MKIFPKIIAEAIYEAAKDKKGDTLSQALHRSAKMLRDKRMLGKSDEVLRSLQNIFDQKTGVVRMKVATAKKISNEERKKIENETKEKYKGKSMVSEFFEKEELLGGM